VALGFVFIARTAIRGEWLWFAAIIASWLVLLVIAEIWDRGSSDLD
jgi:hypothetical protein